MSRSNLASLKVINETNKAHSSWLSDFETGWLCEFYGKHFSSFWCCKWYHVTQEKIADTRELIINHKSKDRQYMS